MMQNCAGLPPDLVGLRACMICSLIKTPEQFVTDGCENCEEFLCLKNNKSKVFECTSVNFDGMIAAIDPERSWVCRWQRIDRFHRGIYAISVSGKPPSHVLRDMENRGIVYRSRDTSQK
ncbi:hypothetical protein R5R35_003089 [Gryllus longicercus]|uniref:Transcription elongation factor SPT4 n=1 Tax=Gryllus longicercus TaxID=2509291 RepID=A0AAN9VUR6_9ORTH